MERERVPAPPAKSRWLDALIGVLMPITIITIPWSVKLFWQPVGLELIFPAEPLIGILAIATCIHGFVDPGSPLRDRSFFRHPITLVILCYLMYGVISMLFSPLQLISVKTMVVRVSYVVVFYVLLTAWSRGRPHFLRNQLRYYSLAIVPVVLFSLVKQYPGGFKRASASFSPFPFYTDHTVYSAALVFVLFFVIAFILLTFRQRHPWSRKVLFVALGALILAALILSFGRAAWISVLGVGVVLGYWFARLGLRWIVLSILVLLGMGAAFRAPLARWVERTQLDSTADGAGFKESFRSLLNVSEDASNQERINRWKCAARMARVRPVVGWGPGTYQFHYIPFQRPEERTYLSVSATIDPKRITRAWSANEELFVRANPQLLHPNGGTAHSEYFMALSETGVPGLILFLALFGAAALSGHSIMRVKGKWKKAILPTSALCSLLAYSIHGLFNNYMDDCKVAFLFWICFALLVRWDMDCRVGTEQAPG